MPHLLEKYPCRQLPLNKTIAKWKIAYCINSNVNISLLEDLFKVNFK